jgi:hypothetical protein
MFKITFKRRRRYSAEDKKLLEHVAVWALDTSELLEDAPAEEGDDYERELAVDHLRQFQALLTRCIAVIDPAA